MLIVISAVFLAFGRLRRQARLNDLALAAAVGLIAVSALFSAAVPVFAGVAAGRSAVWLEIVGFSLACTLFGAAAFVPARPAERMRHVLGGLGACAGGTVALTVILSWALRAQSPARPGAGALALEVLGAAAAAAAAAAYLSRATRSGDGLCGWLAAAAVLATAAEVNYLMYPSLYGQTVSVGDGFRLCFYAVVLLGLIRDVRSYWMALPQAMIMGERRRIARDLHDGLAQELAYLTRNLGSLAGQVDQETLGRLRRASERARMESRQAISTLVLLDRRTVEDKLAEAASEAAERFGVALELDLQPGIQLPAPHSDVLALIAREAVTNAARHSGTKQVTLRLRREGSHVRLRVIDGGSGFDPAGPATGFGISSIREQARSVGGDVEIGSIPGHGTCLEIML